MGAEAGEAAQGRRVDFDPQFLTRTAPPFGAGSCRVRVPQRGQTALVMIPEGLDLDTASSEEIVEKLVRSGSYTQEEAEAVAAMVEAGEILE